VPETVYLQIPPDESLQTKAGWQDLGQKTFAAVRAHIVVIKRREKGALKGSPVKTLDLPGGTEYALQHKTARIVRHAGEIQRSIQETVTSKVAIEVAHKIASEVGATGGVPAAKLSSEVNAKAGAELTEAVQATLATKRSFEVEDAEEITRSISYKPSTEGKKREPVTLQFYLRLWPWKWEFYLYRVEYLRLRYQRNWIWRDVRKTIYTTSADPRRLLFCIRLYEPQDEYSFTEGSYEPDIADEDEVTIESCTGGFPRINGPTGPTLEELARMAFPVTREEKRRAAAKRAPSGKAVKRSAAKKTAAKKASAKKAAGSARKAIHKKAAKKAATKKTRRKQAKRKAR
jgi:hypothetical protein